MQEGSRSSLIVSSRTRGALHVRPSFVEVQKLIRPPNGYVVFGGETFSADNVFGFATAADDGRRVIAFEHDTTNYVVTKIDKAGMTEVCDEIGP